MDLRLFSQLNFLPALKAFFKDLDVPINYVADEPTTAKEILKDTFKDNETFQLTEDVYFVGMVDDKAFRNPDLMRNETEVREAKEDYPGILIFGITLNERPGNLLPTRSHLAEISRAFNREFNYTPVVVVFKYGEHIAFANTERLKYKQEWREGEKAGKVSLLRDIKINNPHSGHERILAELKIPTTGKKKVDSFTKLYDYWQEVLNVSILNKKFYQELSHWYFWATHHVTFPGEPTSIDEHKKGGKLSEMIQEHKATNVIRLLTRLLFTWFIKEKGLIPEEIFDLNALQKDILKKIQPSHENNQDHHTSEESIYYKAILQNLFFATLNCPAKPDETDNRSRNFRGTETYGKHQGVDYLMRYEDYFKNPDKFLQLMNRMVPFLNGGLFECLDDKENKDLKDGFSDNLKGYKETLIVPDYLFFGLGKEVDLSRDYGLKNKKFKKAAVRGLINILHSYKFTVAENTPIEEDVALDPELLGKVFENLLASYNPETKTTARKQTGSFYTPREIVNYMVDESLIAHLKNHLPVPTNVPEASSFNENDGKASIPKVPEASSFNEITPPKTSSFKDLGGKPYSSKEDPLPTHLFKPDDELIIKQGKLPHWRQKDVYYFVTFRLADSIPADMAEKLKEERENWKRTHRNKEKLTPEDLREYNRLFTDKVEEWLNVGFGSCLLKKKENSAIVMKALEHFDGERYELDEWVVMPNHVHLIVKPKEGYDLSEILHSWKSYTANEINTRENRTGSLWMTESYDHIIRNEFALEAIRKYIQENPEKAGIEVHHASFKSAEEEKTNPEQELESNLRKLMGFSNENPFEDDPQKAGEIIDALSNCKILDPACGSGAFPMGALQKMVHVLKKLDPENAIWKKVQRERAERETAEVFGTIEDKKERGERLQSINEAFDTNYNDPDYARKLFLIENCIYGVDIQPIAVQISKLRFFISLVVDQKVNPDKNNFGIRPLPNLETKFVAANTLIGLKKPAEQRNIFDDDEELILLQDQLKSVRNKMFSALTKKTKNKYRQQDEELRKQIANKLIENQWDVETAEKLAQWDPYDQNTSSPFFDPEWMFGIKEGFDVVIGNPPYVNFANLTKNDRLIFKKLFSVTKNKTDLFAFFIEKGSYLTSNNGILSFIIPHTWKATDSFMPLRKLIFEKFRFNSIVDLNFGVFDAIVKPVVIVLERKNEELITQDYIINVLDEEFRNATKVSFSEILSSPNFELDTLNTEKQKQIFKKIESNGRNLKEVIEFSRGIKTSDDARFIHKSINIKSECFPVFRGKNIKSFKLNWNGEYIWYRPDLMKEKVGCVPHTKSFFEVPEKIVTQRVNSSYLLQAAYDNSGNYFLDTVNVSRYDSFSKICSLKSICAILNSKVINFWYCLKYRMPTIGIYELHSIPILIPDVSFDKILNFISSVLIWLDISKSKVIRFVCDGIVFNLYFPDHMKERGIDVLEDVERDIDEVWGKFIGNKGQKPEAFGTLSEEEKERVIEHLHAKWSDPDNEVVKRMAMFKERSPDILKPILES